MNPADIIGALGLTPLPLEGGFYRESYRAAELLPQSALPVRYGSDRAFGTAIYFLLTPQTKSSLHRLPSDEVYHFYLGDPAEMLLLKPDRTTERRLLGPKILAGQQVQTVVPRGVWQGSRLIPGGTFALLGTTVAPSFEFCDYEHGRVSELLAQYPSESELIRALLA